MTAEQHPTDANIWIVTETQTVDQTEVVSTHRVACAAHDSSAERAIEVLTEARNPAGDPTE